MRTITADHTGPIDLTIDIPHAHLTVVADPTIDTAQIVLAPAVPGHRAADAAIEAAQVRVRGKIMRIRIPGTAPSIVAGNIGQGGVSITGGSVVAGTIGGSGNTGAVTIGGTPVPAPLILIDARVPAASMITSDVESGSVRISGPVEVIHCDRGPVVDLSGVIV